MLQSVSGYSSEQSTAHYISRPTVLQLKGISDITDACFVQSVKHDKVDYRTFDSLRNKRSRTTRTKLGPPEGVFSHSGCTKNEARVKKWKERGVGGIRRERLPANPSILKNANWFSRLSSFID